jgi:hypothetical protein
MLPVVGAGILVAGLTAMLAQAGTEAGPGLRRVAAMAEIWLAGPVLLLGIAMLTLIAVTIRWLGIAERTLPPFTRSGQIQMSRLRRRVLRVADALVRPWIEIGGILAAMRSFLGRR